MKTQIIRRISLVVIVLFFSFNDNGSNMQSANISEAASSSVSSINKPSFLYDETKTSIHCCVSAKGYHEGSEIPMPEGDHEFHSFHINNDDKRSGFWRKTFNKIIAILYYLVVLIAYIPTKFFH